MKQPSDRPVTLGGVSNTPPPPFGGGGDRLGLVPNDARLSAYSCGVDYWAATLSANNPLYGAEVARARAVIGAVGSDTAARGGSMLGYTGYTRDGAFIGERDDGALISVSGSGAERIFQRFAGSGWRASRLDLEVTVWRQGINSSSARNQREHAALDWAGVPGAVGTARVLTFSGNDGGHTLYIGAASAQARARIYDKGAETGEAVYAGACRFEIQYRHAKAAAATNMLSALPGDAAQWIVAHVCAWFRERNIIVPVVWDSELATRVPRIESKTDTYRRILWLRETVRPALDKMRSELTEREIRDILGL